MMDAGRPLFQQIAEMIENSIIDGSLAENTQVPSTNELAAFHRINPATAGKGLAQLVTDGVLYKRRGIGMFVTEGARDALRFRRRATFAKQYLDPMLAEARKLGIDTGEIKTMLDDWEEAR
ncbi:GntR family transcriptional regulator [Speluncibacter jeojiensis]|uniref:GntR family transcriptional regulator n=1 Tax=Speluncibacter jeojiensis TaxID=2710754 RepID=UPI00240FE973|nr:GntR family transcriptional regulator [Rhodococcus sp. D2-41]